MVPDALKTAEPSGSGGLTGEDFRRLAELAPDAMLAHRGGQIIWANRAAADLVHVDLASLIGRSLFDFVRPVDRANLAADIARSVAESKATKYVHKFQRSTGEVLEAEFQRWPLGGGVLLVVLRDLTLERQQRSAELRARAFFEATNEAMGISRRGVHVEVNPAYARLFGFADPAELVGRPIFELIDPAEHARIQEYVERRSRRDAPPSSYTVQARRRDGTTFLMDVRGSSYVDGDEEITIVVVRDVTEQRVQEERLRHKEKLEAIGRLAGGVAHDFNNVLAAILANAELALIGLPATSPAREQLVTIGEATRHAAELVKQILTFGRRERPQRAPLEPSKVIGDALTLARAAIPSTVVLEAHLAPLRGAVVADPTELQQIVLNLCSNARDAVGARGRIEVSLDEVNGKAGAPELTGRCARLRVRDDGVGMDEATRARLFEPYHTTRAGQGGHGLGLAVVHGVVTSLGGAIRVDSAPGRGATFDVYLPLSEESAAPPPSSPEAVGGTEHVLLVDDEPLVLSATRRLLESMGYRVTTASDGVEALTRWREGRFALVLTDVTMPRMSGVELMREIRAEQPAAKVMLVSGHSDGLDAVQAKAQGAVRLIAKPITRDDLATAVRAALDASTTAP